MYARILVIVLLTLAAPAAQAAQSVIGVRDALAGVEAGEVTLVDIRTPREWRSTGLPKGAAAIDINAPGGLRAFVGKIIREVGGNKDRPVALICAVGVRSTRAASALVRAGFTKVYNVREGMLGNRRDGPGWIKQKLPVVPCPDCGRGRPAPN